MAEKGIFFTPTLAVHGIVVRAPFENFLTAESKRKNEQVMACGFNAMQMADELGITIC